MADHGQGAAQDGHQHILEVAQVHHNRHKDIGEDIGFGGAGLELLVAAVELLLGGLLVAEDLDDPLAGDHLLDIAVEVADTLLLRDEVLGGVAADLLGGLEHQQQADNDEERQDGAGDQHGDEYGHNRHQAGDGLGNALGEHLPEGIDVVGVVAHDVAEGVGVEVLDGQPLHVVEHVVADFLLDALGDPGHKDALEQGGHHAHAEDGGHLEDDAQQAGEVRTVHQQQGLDVVVHDDLQIGHAQDVGEGRQGDGNHVQHHQQLIVLEVGQEPEDGVFLHAVQAHGAAASVGMRHQAPSFLVCDS